MLRQSVSMGIHPIPWTERAVLVHYLAGDDRQIAFEGSLDVVVHHIETIAPVSRRAYLITLPDQLAPPFGYGWVHFNELIGGAFP
jgi:hypothetical protein